MRSQLRPGVALLFIAVALTVACGSGGNDEPSALGDIPTATPPAVLPDVLIVGQIDLPVPGASYTVADGDILSVIAERFGTTVEAISAANGITDPTTLFIGQVLIIPDVDLDDSVVAPTDEPEPTFDIQPTDEPAATDTPEPEETPVPVEGEIYIVQEGDIPVTIAEQFGITAEELLEANGITDPTSLQIGQELIIPSP
ncbi:MAG: LysM peptidoglycan-binding domain-containing protein [Chloroflexi bacterium]|nr:LysM peptidoglycan-binding domain-containing protein [Chloroflexota bacterium]